VAFSFIFHKDAAHQGKERGMPCHDILVATSIREASRQQVEQTGEFWTHMAESMGIPFPAGSTVYVDRLGQIQVSLASSNGNTLATKEIVSERYAQTYLAKQLYDGLQADGYDMHAYVSPAHEGTWEITARDITRNATIGVTVYRNLQFEIDFLDAMHDDSVWLAGGEFGRVLELLRSRGMDVSVMKMDINQEIKASVSSSNTLLA